ncbi:thioredoxin family protein [Marinifilum flexuosum]|uniref:Thioredoxin-like protein n=1 Tax=Marinifilum flexuosum TaxID=1117708 RepID=A0A419X950_9BACT|nr:thioredoxin family protein [Marinifilum flexuosum]RKE04261.1 thioredoxin-like protein [Marinifilum flexuosum]
MNIAKSIILLFVVLFTTNNIQAQSNLNQALDQAKKENKFILMNFSGSDWCRSCIILKKTILNTDEFKDFAKNELVILDVDFPRSKKNRLSKEQIKINEALAEKYNKKGQFPTIVLLNKDGEVLGKTGYKKLNPDQYISHIKSFLK